MDKNHQIIFKPFHVFYMEQLLVSDIVPIEFIDFAHYKKQWKATKKRGKSVGRKYQDKVYELDLTNLAIDEAVDLIEDTIANGKDHPAGSVDFMDWIIKNPWNLTIHANGEGIC